MDMSFSSSPPKTWAVHRRESAGLPEGKRIEEPNKNPMETAPPQATAARAEGEKTNEQEQSTRSYSKPTFRRQRRLLQMP